MFGTFYFGQSFFGQGYATGGTDPVPPVVPPTIRKAKGGGPWQTREQAWRAQEALAIAADDEELISLVAKLMEEIDP
jgi:hypothetical protein